MTEYALELKITLKGSEPLIWRRIQVSSKFTFFELHHIIQICMGWKNYHMYEFNLEGYSIGEAQESAQAGYEDGQQMESNDIMIGELLDKEGDQFKYLYDYGDYWQHEVIVDKISPHTLLTNSICIDGKMCCPPEDVGGIRGYIASLDILKNKKQPEHKDTVRWFGRSFVPEKFDLEKTNRQLKRLNQYIRKWQNGML